MMNEKCARSPQFSPHPPHELFLSCVTSMISEWHSCLSVFFAHSSCGEFYETKRLAQLDLLSARIPQMEVWVNGAFNKLKKTREMFWSGRPDLNRGPPAPNAGALPGCATPRHEVRKDYKVLPNRTVAPSVHFGLHGVNP